MKFFKGTPKLGSIFVDKDIILSTEHGPRGGDEINLIKKNGNYGWPISSYGDLYFSKQKNLIIRKVIKNITLLSQYIHMFHL